jgi:molybdopterin molybdotransferase
MGRSSPNPALLSFDEASALISAHASRLARSRLPVERVALLKAPGRVLAEPLRADTDQPSFRPLHARRFRVPRRGSLRASAARRCRLNPRRRPSLRTAAARCRLGNHDRRARPNAAPTRSSCSNTSSPITSSGTGAAPTVRLLPPRTVKKGENIVLRGAQARKGEELLPAGTLIGAAQIALAASCGYAELKVYAQAARGHSFDRRRA